MTRLQQTRRDFLKVVGSTTAVSLSGGIPVFWRECSGATSSGDFSDRIVVLIQLAGGNDGLNTVIPVADDAYYRARPGIGIPRPTTIPLTDEIALHPSLKGLEGLWKDKRLAIIEGVGYPQPDRSHFRSMDIWQSAQPAAVAPDSGWIGRSLDFWDQEGKQTREAACIGFDKQPLACVGARVIPPTIQRLEDFQLRPSAQGERGIGHPAWGELVQQPWPDEANSELAFLRRSASSTVASAQRLQSLHKATPTGEYPDTRLGAQLRLVGQMIAADLPTRIFYLSLEGFDTHAQQQGGHAALLAELGNSVQAFMRHMDQSGQSERIVLSTLSEFGRRVAENGSLGTDHGAASVLLSVVPAGRGGVFGKRPSLTDLDDGDLKYTTDFRRVYATLLEKWLGVSAAPILGESFETLDFV